MMLSVRHLLTGLFLLVLAKGQTHPTGNMITVGDHVLWSYINPIEDRNHHACIMIWKKGAEPEIFLQSEYPASDFMLYNREDEIFIIERRHLQASQHFEIRILKTSISGKMEIIWDWFQDVWRIGEGGFLMPNDHQVIFGRHPNIYSLKKGEQPAVNFNFKNDISRIRAVEKNQILAINDASCYLLALDGTLLKEWEQLIDNKVEQAPLGRNQLFDADFRHDQLLIAYWGKRTFEVIDTNGTREILLNQTDPLVPHWVGYFNHEMLLFSSQLTFDGTTPRPCLQQINSKGQRMLIWGSF